jgi:hypothetical protein
VVGANRPPLRFFTIFYPRFSTTSELSIISSLVPIGAVGKWPTLALPASAYRRSSRCFLMPPAKFITNTFSRSAERRVKRPKIHLELLDRPCLDGSLNAWVGNGLKTR